MILISPNKFKLLIYLTFIIISFTITSCVHKAQNPEEVATFEKYEKILESWIDSKDSDLISSWGAPSSTYKVSNGDKIITYTESKTGPTVMMGGMFVPLRFHCKTEFTVNPKNIIIGWRYEGNSCKSK